MTKKISGGFTLFEAVIYIAIFAFLFVLVINVLITMSGSLAELERFRQVTTGGALGLERISRETRDAISVDTEASTLGTSLGVLVLNTEDEAGEAGTISFYVQDGALYVERSGASGEALTGEDTEVTSLVFRHIVTENGEAVKIELEVEATRGARSISMPFYNTIVLKGSYE